MNTTIKVLIVIFLGVFSISSWSQVQKVEVEAIDNGGSVPGKTIRVYLVLANDSDQVYTVYGEGIHLMEIKSTKPFYQSPLGGATSRFVNKKLAKDKPEVRFDSWLTIGAEDNYNNNTDLLLSTDAFEKEGASISTKDGAWYALPGNKQCYPDSKKRVLIMQLTSEGVMFGKFSVMGKDATGQIFHSYDLEFSYKSK